MGTHWRAALLGITLVAAGCGKPAGVPASSIGGRWRVASGAASHDVEVVDRGGSIVFRADGDAVEARRIADGAYEGELRGPEGTLRLRIVVRGDRLATTFTVVGTEGAMGEREVVYERTPPEPAPAATGRGDAELVGHWRRTEIQNLGESNLVTDSHLELHEDGRCVTWSRTEGHVSSAEPRSGGAWASEGDRLRLKADADGGWVEVGRFAFVDGSLVLTAPDGERRFFERVR